MYLHNRIKNNNLFFQKLRDFDFILLVCILLLGFISLATMYSTDGGRMLFHTKSHLLKFAIFTLLMLVISFFNIRFWFSVGYLTYLIIVLMLIWTINFGVTASGSQRWIDLYEVPLTSFVELNIASCTILIFFDFLKRGINLSVLISFSSSFNTSLG